MKFICAVILLFSLIVVATATEKQCEYKGQKFGPGEKFYPKDECLVLTCSEDGKSFTGLTCPSIFPSKGCDLPHVEPEKQYPGCCVEYLCPTPA